MSIKKIAEMAGLSITTVSHAINGTRQVSAANREKIERAIKETGYKPNLAAQMMKTQRSRTIALIIPATEPKNPTNSFYFDVLNGAKVFLEQKGYDLIVSTYPENLPEYDLSRIQVLKRRWIDGILLVPPCADYGGLDSILGLDLPIVLLDRFVESCALPVVCSDNKGVSIEAVKLLAASGRNRIGFLGSNVNVTSQRDRYQGYCEALSQLGYSPDPRIIRNRLRRNPAEGYCAAKELLSAGVDAIFMANSVIAIGMFRLARELGIKIPKEVALIGFDDYEWSEITNPPLTAVSQDADRMGRVGSEILLNIIEGREGMKSSVTIPAKIVLRESH